jgi:uncharacterized membrane protein YkgB
VGLVTGSAALLLTAVTETIIGLTLVTGRLVGVGLLVLAGALGGIMSPLVLFPDQMWSGSGPMLTGQYVLKDIVLAAAGLVVTAPVAMSVVRTLPALVVGICARARAGNRCGSTPVR